MPFTDELEKCIDPVGSFNCPAAASRHTGLVVPSGRRRIVARRGTVVQPAAVHDKLTECAVRDHFFDHTHDPAGAIGQHQGAKHAMLFGRLGHGPEACCAVGEWFVHEVWDAPLYTSLYMGRHLNMLSGDKHCIRLARIETCSRSVESGALKIVRQLSPWPLVAIHHADDFVTDVARNPGHTPSVVTERKNRQPHVYTSTDFAI